MKQKIFIILTLLCMAGIFAFSARDGEKSGGDSFNVGMLVGQIAVPGFEGWSEEKQIEFAKKIDHPVRKTAHRAEYALLAGLCYGRIGAIPLKKRVAAAQAVTSLYAVTDEVHQLFVPGRNGNFTDVLIDSAGGFAMLRLIALATVILGKKRTKTSPPQKPGE